MITRRFRPQGLARPTWKLLSRVVVMILLTCPGLLAPRGLLAQTPPPPPQPVQPLPAPLPPGPGQPSDSQILSLADGLQDTVSPELPRLNLLEPRPSSGPGSVPSFIDGLKGNDAAFEVNVGQGRILTLKDDMTVGANQPLIAVGDPSVLEFAVLNPRQIRITGQRVGVTDLSISTGRNQVYSFEVRVLADLSLLQGRLRSMFPDASVKLAQLRDHIVVEGEARDTAQVARIIETVSSYLLSVQEGQRRAITAAGGGRGLGAMLPMAAAAPRQVNPPAPPVPYDPDTRIRARALPRLSVRDTVRVR